MTHRGPLLLALILTGTFLVVLPAATVTMPVDEVVVGMHGTGITVFQGTERSEFSVEILGVLENSMGPRRNLILARLEGGPLAESGVIQGMSGSPVYVDGRLLGAVLKELDIETLKGNDVQDRKQTLRDIPKNFDLSKACPNAKGVK